jgi:hypothetical protein
VYDEISGHVMMFGHDWSKNYDVGGFVMFGLNF